MVCARKKHEHLDVPLGCLKCNEMGFRALSSGVDSRAATMTASGCPCSKLRAAPFVCRLIASQLALAISFRFEVRTPCCGHGPDHRRRYSHRCLPQPLSPNLLQIVLLEVGATAEEGFVCFRGSSALVFRCRQLNAADVIGELEKAIIGRGDDAVDDCLFREGELDGVVKNMSHLGLPVVVVHLDLIELLEESEIVREEVCQVHFQGTKQAVRVVSEGLLAIDERMIEIGGLFREDAKSSEILLACVDLHALIMLVSCKKRSEMKGEIVEVLVVKRPLIKRDGAFDVVGLIVHDERNQIIARHLAQIARLVDEYGKLAHGPRLLSLRGSYTCPLARETLSGVMRYVCWSRGRYKNAGGNPPALGGRPSREDQLVAGFAAPTAVDGQKRPSIIPKKLRPEWPPCSHSDAGGNPPALGGRPLREDQFPYTTNGRMDARGVSSDSVLHPYFVNCCNAISGQPLCGSEGEDRSACALAGFGLCARRKVFGGRGRQPLRF